jgi:myo-inositol-1(or 4)-monophosphatase
VLHAVKHLNTDNMVILKGIAREVQSAVNSLLGTSESKKTLGKGFGGDQTVLVDEVAEETIINFLKCQKIDCTFIGEEHGVQKIGKKPAFYLIADAVDGTINATRGISFVSTSLALSPTDDLDDVEAALVTNLCNGEMYEAEKGKGAKYKGEKIKTSETAFLNDAVLGIDISRAPNSVEPTAPFMKIAKSVRSFGSASLEICHVASGRFDAYVDLRGMLRTFDIAAAILVVREAGGIVLQPDGKGFDGYPLSELNRFSVIAAANENIRLEIMSIMSQSQD